MAKHSTECEEGINWEGLRIMGREKRTNAEEDARGSDNQTEGDREEGVEHLQPNGAVEVDNIFIPK